MSLPRLSQQKYQQTFVDELSGDEGKSKVGTSTQPFVVSDRQKLLKSGSKEDKQSYGSLSSSATFTTDSSSSNGKKKKKKLESSIGIFSYATNFTGWVPVAFSRSWWHDYSFLAGPEFRFCGVWAGAKGGGITQPTTGNGTSGVLPISREEFNTAISQYSLYYLILGVAMFITSYIQIACWESIAERIVHSIRQNYLKAMLRQEVAWFDKMQTGNLTARLTDDLERVREGLGDKASLFVQQMAAFVAGFAVGFSTTGR
uniref:ABC transmembrane type-1 domain-containing protein n=1 Tax=Ditylenchus dipsaci TaxID=166011 RepID=A0A915EGF1_9BILA